ncbi:MAG: hypothetical protein R2711_19305 [Acidimicrobiales bacterium]
MVGRAVRRREQLGHHLRRGRDDLDARDRIEADSLFDLLEHQIVPLFHDRTGAASGSVPRG